MSKSSDIQEKILNEVRVRKVPVTVFMTNGFQQKGYITSFDGYTILLVNEGKQYLIYKHAVSTVAPALYVKYFEQTE